MVLHGWTLTPAQNGCVRLYHGAKDAQGDPVILIQMAMDRETAEGMFAAAQSDCPEAHQRLAQVFGDLALGGLQLHMDRELRKLTS